MVHFIWQSFFFFFKAEDNSSSLLLLLFFFFCEVGSSWNYFYLTSLLLVCQCCFLYQWGQKVINVGVPRSIKYLLDFLSRASMWVLKVRICFSLHPCSTPTSILLQIYCSKAYALHSQLHRTHISPLGVKWSDTLRWLSSRTRL